MKKQYFVGLVVAVLAAVGLFAVNSQASDGRDCDSNAIMYCGALTRSELISKYTSNSTGDLDNIYNHYGISSADIKSGSVVMGKVYKDGRVTVNGATVATNAQSVGREYMAGSTTVPISGAKNGKVYQRPTSVSFVSGSIDAYVFMKNGQFSRAIQTSCGNPVVAVPVPPKPPTPEPAYACNSLKATKLSRTEYSFATKASASNGASIVNYTYDFGDGKTTTTGATTKHTYTQPGTYTVKVTVNVKVDGKTTSTTSANCAVKVVVEKPPVTPVYKCVALTYDSISRTKYSFKTEATASNGASIVNYTYNFGDGKTATTGATTTHEYAKAGDYTVKVTVNVKVNGKPDMVSSKNCVVTVHVPNEHEITVCELATKKIITIKESEFDKTKHSKVLADCQEKVISVCEISTKQTVEIKESEFDETKYTTDFSKCEEEVVPVELPVTGAADVITKLAGVVSLAGATTYYVASRRNG